MAETRDAHYPLTPLSSLTKATDDIGRARTVDEIVEIIRATARSLIGSQGIAVIKREGDLCHYIEEDAIGPLWKGQKFPAVACISGWAMINRQTVVVPDIETDERIPYELYEKTFVRSLAMAPVRIDDPVGAIGAYWSQPYSPSAWEVDVLEALASAAANAIKNLGTARSLVVERSRLAKERDLAELREQFIAVLGHDLRNPLAAIDAGTSRLLKDGWTDNSEQVLHLMRASVARMAGLVDNVMDLARARLGGGLDLDICQVDVHHILAQVVGELKVAHPDRLITLNTSGTLSVRADGLRLSQMLSNLLSNAISHGTAATPVTVDIRSAADFLEIDVTNGGVPIPQDAMDKLFQPFHRGNNNSGSEGLGLGLFIALEIAKAHGGTIAVRSDDQQTVFTFRMPGICLDA